MFVSRFPSHILKISCQSENLTFFCGPLIIHPSCYCLFWSQLAEVSNAEDLDREKHYITGSLLVLSLRVTRKILPKGGLRGGGGDGSNKRGG